MLPRASLLLVLLAACERPPAPGASSAAVDAEASAPAPAPRGNLPGTPCSGPNECAEALVCCPTGFHGRCGGAAPSPSLPADPCVFTSTCVHGPCRPLAMPP